MQLSRQQSSARGVKPRVVFIDQVGQKPGGAQRSLAIFLRFAGHFIEPAAILFEDGSFAEELRNLGIPVDVILTHQSIVRATREQSGAGAARFVPSLLWEVVKRIRAYRPDLVYTNSMKAHVIGSIAARLTGTPCIVHFHDLLEGRALRTLQTACRIGSNQQVACSQLVAAAMGVPNTHVIYAPVDVHEYQDLESREKARAHLGIVDDLPVVALIGRINRWKGHDSFVRIAARVNANLPVNFLIVGAPVFRDADFVPELRSMIDQLGLHDRVLFSPWADDVRLAYAATDINTNCSRREPFGRAIPEAAAAGVPTICFSDSGASETITNGLNGFTIPPGDEAAFADAIISLLADARRLQKMGHAAKASAVMFDARVITQQLAELISVTALKP